MPAGRPTKYREKYHVPWARGMALTGATMEEIAESMQVSKQTLYTWMDEHEEFMDAINEGRAVADSRVVESLYNKAMGKKVTERKTIVATDEDGTPRPLRTEVTERECLPDTAACIFWLKNRQPNLWRDKREVDMTDTLNGIQDVLVSIRNVSEQDGQHRDNPEAG